MAIIVLFTVNIIVMSVWICEIKHRNLIDPEFLLNVPILGN